MTPTPIELTQPTPTELWTESSRYPREGTFTRFLLVRPRALAQYPAVILVPDGAGMTPVVREHCQRLARAGLIAFAVDLFARFGVARPQSRPMGEELLRRQPDREWVSDLGHAFAYLHRRADVDLARIAAMGIGAGGHYAFQHALIEPGVRALICVQSPFLAESDLGEAQRLPIEAAQHLGCPLLGLYGEADPALPMRLVEELTRTLERHHKAYHVKTYPGVASLLDPAATGFDRQASEDAWQLITKFARERLLAKAGVA